MKESLFQEFPDVPAEQWKDQIKQDLKGASYDEKLIFRSLDGIEVQPFYTSADVKDHMQLPPPLPWRICEKINVASAGEGNTQATKVLQKGAESLWLHISSESVEPDVLFEGFNLKNLQVHLSFSFFSPDYVEKLKSYFKNKNTEVHLQLDVLGNIAATGSWFFDQKRDFKILKSVIESTPHFASTISINCDLYQNAGATIPQQLAFSLAHANEYLNLLCQKGEKQDEFQLQFIVATGSNYFFEIAKIRALRLLNASLAKEYDLPKTCFILAQPSQRDKTLYDYNVNLLRSTTQCMSAVLGGADAVSNQPYDLLFHKDSSFGRRIARNQLLVMKHEAYFDKVANPADGAYYIEHLTHEFADKALEIFKQIEEEGGFLKLLLKGELQKRIKVSAQKEQQLFDEGKLVLIGTNKFENSQDLMTQELEFDPLTKNSSEDTLIEPLFPVRLSEKLEQERLKKEQGILTES
jgi:methylmalonyl-CoA mutase